MTTETVMPPERTNEAQERVAVRCSALFGVIRVAYADPPYIGQSKKHYGKHKDFGGEVNHEELIGRLCRDYPDGWALSLSCKSLKTILAMCPDDVRVMAWVKPWSAFLPGIRVQYGYEPVIMRGGRQERPKKGDRKIVDWVSASPKDCLWKKRPEGHVIGQKPKELCEWLFTCLGLRPGDHLDDLFPGSGAVTKHFDGWINQRTLL